MDESYRKCRTCRFCRHADGMWVCLPESRATESDGTCGRYRLSHSEGRCSRTGDEVFPLDVCSHYDPAGSL